MALKGPTCALESFSGLNLEVSIAPKFHPEGTELFTAEGKIRREINPYLEDKLVSPIFRANSDYLINEKILVLKAPGAYHGRYPEEYWYSDGRRLHRVQDWVNANDGKGSLMIILACNPWGAEVCSKKSLVVHPAPDPEFFHVYLPNFGYVDPASNLHLQAIEELI